MDTSIRWRIMSLQAFMVVVLAAAGCFAFIGGTVVTNQVRGELTAQQIYFPAADQIKAGGALDPAQFSQEIRDQAGSQVTDGNQARIYANDFIGKHLQKIANGQTYAQVSSAAGALTAKLAATPTTDPSYASMQSRLVTLSGQKQTLFQGQTLRGNLLNAYGWWTVGIYTTYAAIGLLIASLGALGALAFELFLATRKPPKVTVAHNAVTTAA